MNARLVLAFALYLSAGLAQTTGGGESGSSRTVNATQSSTGSFSGTYSVSGLDHLGSRITGAPYSAELVIENVQTLADGTHITRTMPTERIYRDSQGRTRVERSAGRSMGGSAPAGPLIAEIRDPADGVAYILDTQGKVAHRVKSQPLQGRLPSIVTPSSSVIIRPPSTFESLGSQVMEGVVVEGWRTTFTHPVGSIGNDRPIVSMREQWMSRELGLTILSIMSHPQGGVNTTRIFNISRAEPDMDLFRPPADYTIVDEVGPTVTIQYGK